MRRIAAFACCLLLAACYQAGGETVGTAEGRRVEGIADGLYRRPDGSELMVRWSGAERAYAVGIGGGRVRAVPLGNGLWLLDYAERGHIALLARPDDGAIQVLLPRPAAQSRLLAAHRLHLEPGPLERLAGTEADVRAYFKALAADSEALVAGERLVRVEG